MHRPRGFVLKLPVHLCSGVKLESPSVERQGAPGTPHCAAPTGAWAGGVRTAGGGWRGPGGRGRGCADSRQGVEGTWGPGLGLCGQQARGGGTWGPGLGLCGQQAGGGGTWGPGLGSGRLPRGPHAAAEDSGARAPASPCPRAPGAAGSLLAGRPNPTCVLGLGSAKHRACVFPGAGSLRLRRGSSLLRVGFAVTARGRASRSPTCGSGTGTAAVLQLVFVQGVCSHPLVSHSSPASASDLREPARTVTTSDSHRRSLGPA